MKSSADIRKMENSPQKSRFANPYAYIGLALALWAILIYGLPLNRGLEFLGAFLWAYLIALPAGLAIILVGLIKVQKSWQRIMKIVLLVGLLGGALTGFVLFAPDLVPYRQKTPYQAPIGNQVIPPTEQLEAANYNVQTIAITFPNGGEKLVKGQSYTITWKTEPDFNYPQVSITLVSSPSLQAVTPDQPSTHITANTGSYAWTIPKDFQPQIWVADGVGADNRQTLSNDQTGYRFLIEGWPPVGRAQGPFGYSNAPFYIISQ